MDRTIAFFDFDGTITRKDSMIEFIKFVKGKGAFYKSLALLSPWLSGMKLGIISNTSAKEKMLAYFFKGMHIDEFTKHCRAFAENRLPQLIRKDALNAIKDHKSKGHEVVVVSASAENWISYWCSEMQLQFLGTKLSVDEQMLLTGKIDGANCNGAEKVNRIILSYDPAVFKTIYCYGDTKGDAPMLKLATHPYYRYFKK